MSLRPLQILLCLIVGIHSLNIQFQNHLLDEGNMLRVQTSTSFTIRVELQENPEQKDEQTAHLQLFDAKSKLPVGFIGERSCRTRDNRECLLENLIIEVPGEYYFVVKSGFVERRSELIKVSRLEDTNASQDASKQDASSKNATIQDTPAQDTSAKTGNSTTGNGATSNTNSKTSSSGSTVASQNTTTPASDSVTPVNDSASSNTNSSTPSSDSTKPSSDSTGSPQNTTTPSSDSVTPVNDSTSSNTNSSTPSSDSTTPKSNSTVSSQNTTTPVSESKNPEATTNETVSNSTSNSSATATEPVSDNKTSQNSSSDNSSSQTSPTQNTTSGNSSSQNTSTPEPVPVGPKFYLVFQSVTPKVSFTQEIFVESEFSVKVAIYNKSSSALAADDSQSVINLTLSGTELKGNTSATVKSGIATFDGLQVFTIGSYNLTASSVGLDSVTYEKAIEIKKWPLNRIDVSIDEVLTSYFEFEIKVSLINGAEKPFLDAAEVALQSNLTLVGTTSATASNGKVTFKVYTKASGAASFTVTSGSISKNFESFINRPKTNVTTTSQLTQTSNVFNLTVRVLDFKGVNLLTLAKLNITISLNPTGKLYGNNSIVVTSGEGVLNNIVIISHGTFTFLATVSNNETASVISSGNSNSYEITQEQSNLPAAFQILTHFKIEPSTLTPSAYFNFRIHVYLYNQVGKSYDNVCEAGVVGSVPLFGSTYMETASGQANFEIYSKSTGRLNILTTVCETFSRSTEIDVLPLTGKIDVVEHIKRDSNYFDVRVGIYDNEMKKLETVNAIYNISLELSPNGLLSGSHNYPHAIGEWNFQRITILSPGTFWFKAFIREEEGPSVLDVKSVNSYKISKDNAKVPRDLLVISEIIVDVAKNVSVFEPLILKAIIKDQQGNLWNEECNVVLNSNLTISGDTSVSTTNGSIDFQIYFKDIGISKITILTCDGLTDSFEVLILPYTQKVKLISHIANDSNYFEVLVEIYDSYGENILETYGNFDIELFLLPKGNLTSNAIGTAAKGTKYFSPVTILTPGTYQFGVNISEHSGLEPAVNPYIINQTFVITEENAFIPKDLLILSYMNVSLSIEEPTVFFNFEVVVNLFDQVNSTWMRDTEVQLTSNEDIFGKLNKTAVGGEAKFEVFFKRSGKFKLYLKTKSGLSREIKVRVEKARLQIEPVFRVFNDSHYFNVSVDILDSSLKEIEKENGEYTVTLFSVPETEIHGNLTSTCEKGVCKFAGLSIRNNGTYRLGASVVESSVDDEPAKDTYSEASFVVSPTIAHIYLYRIELYQKIEATEYVNSEINVLLLDINNALYNETIEYSVSSSEIYHGPAKVTSLDGNTTFKFYYTEVGHESVNVSSGFKSKTIGIEIQKRINYPMLALIIIFWIMVVLCVIFYVNDKHQVENECPKFGLSLYCPALSFITPGPHHRRIVTALRVYASTFAMFTLLGICYNYELLDSPNAEEGFDAYGLEDWYEGFLVLIIVQCFTVPFAFLHYFNLESAIVGKLISVVSFMIIALSLIFAAWGLTVFTAKYYLFWMLTFVIYSSIEFFLIQSIYGMLFACFFYKPPPPEPMLSPTSATANRPFLGGLQRTSLPQQDNSPKKTPRISFLYRK